MTHKDVCGRISPWTGRRCIRKFGHKGAHSPGYEMKKAALLFDCYESTAILSDDERYRYWLNRIWDSEKPLLYFVMLNPSTADETIDDRTIKKCIGFAKYNGFGGIAVLNLFAFRATWPEDMLGMGEGAIGFENDEHLSKIPRGAVVCCAWGSIPYERNWTFHRVQRVKEILRSLGVKATCVNKSGVAPVERPRHPLYVKYGELLPYSLEVAA